MIYDAYINQFNINSCSCRLSAVIDNKKMPIKNFIFGCTFFALIITETQVNAADIDPALTTPIEQSRQRQFESQEQQRQQEILKSLRQQQEIKPDVRDEVDALKQTPLKASIEIPDNETPCFTINRIELVGNDAAKFQFALDDLTTKLTTDYTHSGEWQADGNATFTTTGSLTNQAKLLAGGNLDMTAANINNQASGEIAGANLNIAVTNTLTNRGLLDGGDTFINTATLNNIGTGRIYGDHVAIAATTLNNTDETVNGMTTAAVIAARDRLDIGAANITNREHGLLFSAGDTAIGGSLDANHLATVALGQPQAAVLNNNSATIEALGNLVLNVATINNTNEHFTTTSGIVSESTTPARSTDVRGLQLTSGSPAPASGNTRQYQLSYFSTDGALLFGDIYNYDQVSFYTPGFVHIVLNPGVPGAAYTDPLTGSNRDFVTFMQYNNGTIVTETSVATTDPGQILAGGSMQINATDVLNSDSKIIAGGALSGNARPLSSWIVPYADTRSDPRRDQVMHESKTGLQVANLSWSYDSLFSGWSTNSIMGVEIYYDRVARPGPNVTDISTPEKLRAHASKRMHSRIPSQAAIDEAKRDGDILNSAGNRVYLDTETTVINGRVWTRQAMNGSYDRLYKYITVLSADRMLVISISMANFDFNANPDFTTYPGSLKRAFAQMDEMVASLRVAKRNDDGSPDPFVIERVEPAPLPVR